MKRKYINPFFNKMYSRNDVYNEEDIRYLRQLARSKDWENRSRVAELLCNCEQDFVEKLLHEMTFDKDELVRADAADSLGGGKTLKSFERLWHLAEHDKSELVQFHAVLSCGEIYLNMDIPPYSKDEFKERLYGMIHRVESPHIGLSCYEVLYLLGETSAVEKIISVLGDAINNGDGTLIWHALHTLEAIDTEDIEKYRDGLKELQTKLSAAQKNYLEEILS